MNSELSSHIHYYEKVLYIYILSRTYTSFHIIWVIIFRAVKTKLIFHDCNKEVLIFCCLSFNYIQLIMPYEFTLFSYFFAFFLNKNTIWRSVRAPTAKAYLTGSRTDCSLTNTGWSIVRPSSIVVISIVLTGWNCVVCVFINWEIGNTVVVGVKHPVGRVGRVDVQKTSPNSIVAL